MAKQQSIPPRRAPAKKQAGYSPQRFLKDLVEIVVPAVILFLIIHTFFLESRFVPTPSMVPTIGVQDWFLSNKTAYWFQKPQRGQIVVFKPPTRVNSKEDFVKRIIGLPGETIELRQGAVYINGRVLAEPYISPDRAAVDDFGPYLVPRDQVFVMGDNRNNSMDSRYWGPLAITSIKGQAWWRYWPVQRLGMVR